MGGEDCSFFAPVDMTNLVHARMVATLDVALVLCYVELHWNNDGTELTGRPEFDSQQAQTFYIARCKKNLNLVQYSPFFV
jgi:hypothetical protein